MIPVDVLAVVGMAPAVQRVPDWLRREGEPESYVVSWDRLPLVVELGEEEARGLPAVGLHCDRATLVSWGEAIAAALRS
jgi:hypothetical protein